MKKLELEQKFPVFVKKVINLLHCSSLKRIEGTFLQLYHGMTDIDFSWRMIVAVFSLYKNPFFMKPIFIFIQPLRKVFLKILGKPIVKKFWSLIKIKRYAGPGLFVNCKHTQVYLVVIWGTISNMVIWVWKKSWNPPKTHESPGGADLICTYFMDVSRRQWFFIKMKIADYIQKTKPPLPRNSSTLSRSDLLKLSHNLHRFLTLNFGNSKSFIEIIFS